MTENEEGKLMQQEHTGIQYCSIKELIMKLDANITTGLSREEAHERRNGHMNKISEPIGFSRYFCCLLACFGISNQMDALRKIIPTAAQARRNGRIIQIDPLSLVAGDIVYISCGDFVPADLRVIEADECLFDTHALTGRSEVLEGDPNIGCSSLPDSPNMALAGFQCKSGSCVGLVVATGSNCYLSQLVSNGQFPVPVGSSSRPLATTLEFSRV